MGRGIHPSNPSARSKSVTTDRTRLWHFSPRLTSTVAFAVLILLGVSWWAGIIFLLHRADGLGTSSPESLRGGLVGSDRLILDVSIGAGAADKGGATPVFGIHDVLGPNPDEGEIVYAAPHDDTDRIVGVALLLHACTHSALKFFSPTPNLCDACIGLSEELAISRTLLERGYAVLAVTSSDRKSGCWGGAKDIHLVQMALDKVRGIISTTRSNAVTNHLRVVAIGASSGGRFAVQVAADGLADAAIVMVMGIGESLRSRLMGMGPENIRPPPPIYLAPMPRDERTAQAVRKDWEVMSAAPSASMTGSRSGVEEKYPIVLDEQTCVPLPVSASYLHGRVPALGLSEAKAIVDALTGTGHLDRTTGLLQKDPTRSDWRAILQRECGGGEREGDKDSSGSSSSHGDCLRSQPLTPGRSPLAKALHRAWAFHEYCSEVVPAALDYFERTLEARVGKMEAPY